MIRLYYKKSFISTMLFAVLLAALVLAARSEAVSATNDIIDLKLILICADGSEPSCQASEDLLRRLGTPHTLLRATTENLTADMLFDGASHAYYAGVLLATGNLAFYNNDSGNWESALSPEEWQTLRDFEARFSLREVSLYTFPTADYGLEYIRSVDTATAPLPANLTAAGQELFSYLNPSTTLTFKNAWGYLARPAFLALPTGSETTPLIVTSDGFTIAAIHHYPDGRLVLALCVDNHPDLVHSQALMYGLIRWVSKGLFLGERHVYLSPQIDDIFLANELWDPATNTTSTAEYRLTPADLDAVTSWQQTLGTAHPTAAAVRLNMVFNGEGTTAYGQNDPLTARARELQSSFYWTNHTYSHLNLDAADYAHSLSEIQTNNTVATNLGLSRYDTSSLITGDMSGLANNNFLAAARDAGIYYLASNASIPGQGNPTPNTGIVNPVQPSLLEIPRHPTNIYYNVVTPEQEVSQYNFNYHSFWGRDLTYPEIIEVESNRLLNYMLTYDIDPLMFHQSNLGVYSSSPQQRTLMTDLLNAALAKYESLFRLPLVSHSFAEIGQKMKARAQFEQAGVSGSVTAGVVTLNATKPCTVPVTGLSGVNDEIYGQDHISYINLTGDSAVSSSYIEPPRLENRLPSPGSTVNDGRPHIGVDYTDPAWGIDTSSVKVILDGNDVTASSLVTSSFIAYVPAQTLADGMHTVQVIAASLSGQVTQDSWSFQITTPKPVLSVKQVLWGSYEDYRKRQLSVTYQLTNTGSGTGVATTLQGSVATNGVILVTSTPIDLGNLAPLQTVSFTLKYQIPVGTSRFRTTTYLVCSDNGGNIYGAPAP